MRSVTLSSVQWNDIPLENFLKKASSWGYDGVELNCSGNHLDLTKAAKDKKYCKKILDLFACRNLKLLSLKNPVGQLVCDPDNDPRSDMFCPKKFAGKPEAKRKWAVEQMKLTAKAAANLEVEVVSGLTGSPIWHLFYNFPPVPAKTIQDGFDYVADMWNPILDAF